MGGKIFPVKKLLSLLGERRGKRGGIFLLPPPPPNPLLLNYLGKRRFFFSFLDRVQVQGTAVLFQSPTARRRQRRDEQTGGI